jgi:hypothetical protein
MEACEGLIVINAGAGVMIAGAGAGLMALVWWGIKEAIKGRDNHIISAENINADLTEVNRILSGTASGAIETVKAERRGTSGRQRL